MPDSPVPRCAEAVAAITAHATPFFSVIMPTRNRPELLKQALDSVLSQSFRDFEVIVINDGSGEEYLPAYRALEEASDTRVSWLHQPRRPNGHGPSYSINSGAQAARGQYLCILDDDDSWQDHNHLATARDVLAAAELPVDVYYSNQRAYTADGNPLGKSLWLGTLAKKLPSAQAGLHGTHKVSAEFLLSCNGFPHLNCTIIRRDLYLKIGGMDEGIRYECEVDLYLRTLDAASQIIYNPKEVARHNIPDPVSKRSVSTAVTQLHKRLSQINVYEKNLARAPSPLIRDTCVRRLAMFYRMLAEHFKQQQEYATAAAYARVALAYRSTLKWRCYSLYLHLLAATRKDAAKE